VDRLAYVEMLVDAEVNQDGVEEVLAGAARTELPAASPAPTLGQVGRGRKCQSLRRVEQCLPIGSSSVHREPQRQCFDL
jgi:hypothetical protein